MNWMYQQGKSDKFIKELFYPTEEIKEQYFRDFENINWSDEYSF